MFTKDNSSLLGDKKRVIHYASCLPQCGIKNHVVLQNKRPLGLGIVYYFEAKINA